MLKTRRIHAERELAERYLAYGKTKTGQDKAASTLNLQKQLTRDYVMGKFGDRIAIDIDQFSLTLT